MTKFEVLAMLDESLEELRPRDPLSPPPRIYHSHCPRHRETVGEALPSRESFASSYLVPGKDHRPGIREVKPERLSRQCGSRRAGDRIAHRRYAKRHVTNDYQRLLRIRHGATPVRGV